MRRLVPVPFVDHVPEEIKDGAGPLGAIMDNFLNAMIDDSIGLEDLKNPARCPAQFLDAFGEMVAAGIRPGDDERTKRFKIANAGATNTKRGLWVDSVKPLIDARAGGDAEIVGDSRSDDFIIYGVGTEPVDTYWSCIGGVDPDDPFGIRIVCGGGTIEYEVDTIALGDDQAIVCGLECDATYGFIIGGSEDLDEYGTRILGDGTEVTTETGVAVEGMIKGTFLIDVDNPSLTTKQVEDMVEDLKDQIPAYFLVYLGYVQAGTFIPYPNGIIGG